MLLRTCSLLLGICLIVGCTDKPKGELPPLYPAKGKVVRGGKAVTGGAIQWKPTTDAPETRDLNINAEVNADGTFELSTLHAVSFKKAPGAPAGTYQIIFTPPQSDQTQGGNIVIVELPGPFTVKSEPNEFTIELGKEKK